MQENKFSTEWICSQCKAVIKTHLDLNEYHGSVPATWAGAPICESCGDVLKEVSEVLHGSDRHLDEIHGVVKERSIEAYNAIYTRALARSEAWKINNSELAARLPTRMDDFTATVKRVWDVDLKLGEYKPRIIHFEQA